MGTLSAAAETWKLVGGVGLGPIQLGKAYTDANRFLTPDVAMGTQRSALLRYKEGVDLECGRQLVQRIILLRTSFQGKTGPVDVQVEGNIKIGSSVSQLEAALGRSYISHDVPVAKNLPKETYYAYQSKCLGFRASGGKIVEIATWAK